MDEIFNQYNSAVILCRRCIDVPIPEKELAEYLDRYMETLEPELRVPPGQYAARLELCADCQHRLLYTCRKCGCYVQVRAAKREGDCPLPRGEKKWLADEEI